MRRDLENKNQSLSLRAQTCLPVLMTRPTYDYSLTMCGKESSELISRLQWPPLDCTTVLSL